MDKSKEGNMMYYNSKKTELNFEDSIKKLGDELQKEGFGILTEIDVQAVFKKKIGADFRKYKILGACNPNFAHKAIQTEENIGTLLPCNFVVQENDKGEVSISSVNPLVTMQNVGNEKLTGIAQEVSAKLNSVLSSI